MQKIKVKPGLMQMKITPVPQEYSREELQIISLNNIFIVDGS